MAEDWIERVKWDEDGLVPAIAQETSTNKVLTLAWMNRESLAKTAATGEAHYWSRSRKRLWKKGEQSGNVQTVREIRLDCDEDEAQLLLSEAGQRALGDRRAGDQGSEGNIRTMSDILERLADVVESRKAGDPEKSYVSRLFARGPDAILKKVGEEATEAVMAAKDGDRLRIVGETADLWFHCLIMLAQYGLRPADVLAELRRREGISGIDEKAARADKRRAKVERK